MSHNPEWIEGDSDDASLSAAVAQALAFRARAVEDASERDLQSKIRGWRDRADAAEQKAAEVAERMAALERRARAAEIALIDAQARTATLERELEAITSSPLWRSTGFLRGKTKPAQ